LHLVYSPDGRYLAATLFGKNGVRVFSTSAYTQVGEDRDYGDSSYCADFDRAGRLVTTSVDGFIHLYATGSDGSLRLLAKWSAAGGQLPFDVKFSPDGTRVAVGFANSMKVAVLQAIDLAPLYAPDATGVTNGPLGMVAWSADGRTLYAGGRATDANKTYFIRAWADGGRGGFRDISGVATDSIMDILPLRDGGIVYSAGEPSLGVIDASGRFSLADRKLEAAPAESVNWRPPETEETGKPVPRARLSAATPVQAQATARTRR
jgi:WD40 repeat protein